MIGNIFQGFQQFSQAVKPLVNLLDRTGDGRVDCADFKILYVDWCKFQHKYHDALHAISHGYHHAKEHAHHAKEHAHHAHENSTHQNKNYSSHHEQSEQNSKDWTFYCHPNGVCERVQT
ncbi:hypothetical protein [Pseudanabaena mucicola]|uniref:hypothetical protein n=1 Tax=Pseudanabaena mucicola TaxID=71190 RepID=UPI002576A548|nr:hypothetical protein [Pseudanabaena mucicola]